METTRFAIKFLDQDVINQFSALPKHIQKRVKNDFKNKLEVNPILFGKPLQHSLKGHRRLRVGDYRVIYRIELENIIVIIVKVGIRRDIY